MRRTIRTAACIAIAALLFHAAASEAFTPSLLSRATGTIWGTNAGDEDVSLDGIPVSSAAAYTRPPEVNDGAMSASASAAFGTLGARSELSVTNAPGYLSAQYPLYGTSRAEGLRDVPGPLDLQRSPARHARPAAAAPRVRRRRLPPSRTSRRGSSWQRQHGAMAAISRTKISLQSTRY